MVDTFTTLVALHKEERADEHHAKVDDREQVHGYADSTHLGQLQILHRLAVVLETEGLVLCMDERLPDPHWEHNVVPALQVDRVLVVKRRANRFNLDSFSSLGLLHIRLLLDLKKLLIALLVSRVVQRVLDVHEAHIDVEHAHQHFQVLVRDLVITYV